MKHNKFMINYIYTQIKSHQNLNCDELSIALLYPHIEKAITEYYGYSRRYEIGDSTIEIIKRTGNVFNVQVTVNTFEGPHNDYFTEIMTSTVTPFSITLDDYLHCDFNP